MINFLKSAVFIAASLVPGIFLSAQTLKDAVEKIPLKEYNVESGIYVQFFSDAQKNLNGKNTEYVFQKINDDNSMLVWSSLRIVREYSCVDPKELMESLKKDFGKLGEYTVNNVTTTQTGDEYFSPKSFQLKGLIDGNDKMQFERVLTAYDLSNNIIIIDLVYPKNSVSDYYKKLPVRFSPKVTELGISGIYITAPIHFRVLKEEKSEYYYVTPCDRYTKNNLQLILRDFSYPDDYDPELGLNDFLGYTDDEKVLGYEDAEDLMLDAKIELISDPNVSALNDILTDEARFNRPDEIYIISYVKKEGTETFNVYQYFVRFGKKVISAYITGPVNLPSGVNHRNKLEDIINSIEFE